MLGILKTNNGMASIMAMVATVPQTIHTQNNMAGVTRIVVSLMAPNERYFISGEF